MGYERWTKPQLIARLEQLEEALGGVEMAVWRCVTSLDAVDEFDQARVSLAFDLAGRLKKTDLEPKDAPRVVNELRAILAELEPAEDEESDLDEELRRLTSG